MILSKTKIYNILVEIRFFFFDGLPLYTNSFIDDVSK